MSQPFCHHVNPAGIFCGGPPVNKRNYCFWHLHETGRRLKAARARARRERVIIQLPVLDDLHAVQIGLMQLAEAIAHGEIDQQSGRLLLSVLRLAASNLKSDQGWRPREQHDTFGVDATIVIEDPRFEHQYGLPKDFNLNVAPEVAFPPPAEPEVEAPGEEPGNSTRLRRQRPDHPRREPKRKGAASQPVPTLPAAFVESPTEAASSANRRRKPTASSDFVSSSHKITAASGA